jgi:hypothetical protein
MSFGFLNFTLYTHYVVLVETVNIQKNHLNLPILMFFGCREMDGVGRVSPKLLGFQVYFAPSYLLCFFGEMVSLVFF